MGATLANSTAASAARDLSGLHEALPDFPRERDDDGGPVFNAPWEAQAFAMTVALHERGAFTWSEWAHELAKVIGEVKARGDLDTGGDYYRHWLAALERIATRKGIVTGGLLAQRRDEWDEAARNTPHGKAIELRSSA